jgi:hypothetical protein
MGVGSVWLPIVVCLAMLAICCGGPLLGRWWPLLGRWQQTRRRAHHARSDVRSVMASADGHKVGSDG